MQLTGLHKFIFLFWRRPRIPHNTGIALIRLSSWLSDPECCFEWPCLMFLDSLPVHLPDVTTVSQSLWLVCMKSLIKIIEFVIKACLCLFWSGTANFQFKYRNLLKWLCNCELHALVCVNVIYSMYVTTPNVHISVGKETKSKFTTSGAKNSGVPNETLSFSRGLYLKRDEEKKSLEP